MMLGLALAAILPLQDAVKIIPLLDTVTVLSLQDAVTQQNYAKIELGMAKKQVIQILGGPPLAHVTDADRDSRLFTVASSWVRKNGQLWRIGSFKVWVHFDEHGRVNGKALDNANDP